MLAPLTPPMALALLTPSARVLAAVARPGGVEPLSLPWEELHWPTLVSLMVYERAESQVWALLRRVPDRVPEDVRGVVQGMARVARFRAAALSDAVAEVVDVLEASAVPVLWLKGAALAMQRAEGFSVRGMGDVDLLVAPADQVRARTALSAAGWTTPAVPGYKWHHHDAPMVRSGGARLELHTSLFPPNHPFAADAADDWLSRGEEVRWGERRVRVLPRPWHVVHASTHWAWNHTGQVGSWQYLHDMHRLTEGWKPEGPEWDAVLAHAGRIGAQRPVGWGVWSAHRLAGLPVSEAVVHRFRGPARTWDGMVERQWVLAAFYSPAGSPSVQWTQFWWRRAMQGLGDAAGQWPWVAGRAAVVPTPSEEAPAVARRSRNRWSNWHRHLRRLLQS
jgi:hypothetical protein